MATEIFKEPSMKRLHPRNDNEAWSPSKKKRIKENFLNFCDIVLSYTKYDTFRHEELRTKNNTSPLDSGGSTADSYTSDTASSWYQNTDDETSPQGLAHRRESNLRGNHQHSRIDDPNASPTHDVIVEEDDSYELITCFCGKPYAGRPMIECSACLTWLHLTCAKVRRNNIPETFVCDRCGGSTNKSCNNNNNNKSQLLTKKRHRKSGGIGKLTPGKGGKSPRASNTSPVTAPSLKMETGFIESPELTTKHPQYQFVNNVVPGPSASNSQNFFNNMSPKVMGEITSS